MSFTESIATCFSKYVDFSGRARRSEFWWFALFLAIVDIALSLVSDALSGLWNLGTLLPYAAVAWRRLHDTDRTGLWTLVPLIPLIVMFIGMFTGDPFNPAGPLFWLGLAGVIAFSIVNIVFWASRGTSGPNQYGEDPLE